MKQILYALVVFCAFGLLSCRKSRDNFTIQQFDADQIQTYIKNNGLTGMVKDTSGGDTTGIYYQIITPGTGKVLDYPDKVSFVFTARSFDGGYVSTDTILNHVNTFTAYVGPTGVELAIKGIAKRKGTKIRVLIPSRLAYGINGTTLSSYNTAGAITYSTVTGNQCLDYTINILDDDIAVVNNVPVNRQSVYDDISIQKYLSANGLTGYTKIQSGIYTGLYYKVLQVGTGSDAISEGSTVGLQYTGTLFNGIIFDSANIDDGTAADTFYGLYDVSIPAWKGVLPLVTAGAKVSMIAPSKLAFGQTSSTNGTFTVPAFSCIRYDFNVISVTN